MARRLELHEFDKGDPANNVKPIRGNDLNVKSGQIFVHMGNGTLYGIVGVSRDAQRDRWMIDYREYDIREGTYVGIRFSHLPEDFHREGRFKLAQGRVSEAD